MGMRRALQQLWRAVTPHTAPLTGLRTELHSVRGCAPCQDHVRYSSTTVSTTDPNLIRSFAIIAHVDHGKTTLVDKLLTSGGGTLSSERAMDSNDLEKERGITISSKYTSFQHKGYTLNVVDTPGHADFGGEVERVLGMVDGAVLLVDATEGPLSQTKFVVEKALQRGLRPLVVLNKVDRPAATPERCGEVESAAFDTFALLGADDDQLDFPVLYASAREGWASRELLPRDAMPPPGGMGPLLDALIEHVPPPLDRSAEPFSFLVVLTERDSFLGRVSTGRIATGSVAVGDAIKVIKHTGEEHMGFKVTKLFKRSGQRTLELQRAVAGDIVSIAGAPIAGVADTIGDVGLADALPPGQVDPPTLSMIISPNTSPLAGREGTQLTGSKIGERLRQEAETNVSLRVLPVTASGGEAFEVQARGELQLGLLIENMRREGFELSVSPPRVVFREEAGRRLEPIEEVGCEVADEHAGEVIEAMSNRKGEMTEMVPLEVDGKQRLTFDVPSRGLIGFRSAFATITRGSGLLHRAFSRYDEYRGPLDRVRKGVLVSTATGRTTLYALGMLEARGDLFVGDGGDVYEGMIIGESSRDGDMGVNPVREKKLSNMRSAGADEKVHLTPPRLMTLEDVIGYVAGDELIEVTPTKLRLRKRLLNASARKSASRAG
ncbi:EFG7 [Auxenochlorella protothecoides x Auxenochlorella symbiontica]